VTENHKHVFDSDVGWFHTSGNITIPTDKIIGTAHSIVLYCKCGLMRYIVSEVFYK